MFRLKKTQHLITWIIVTFLISPASFATSSPSNSATTNLSKSIVNSNYPDIKGLWAEKQILSLIDSGIIKGIPTKDNKFTIQPARSITRAEFVAVLVKCNSLKVDSNQVKSFKDVKSTDWFKSVVDAAVSKGIVSGYPDGTFRPDSPITRGEIASIIANSFGVVASSKKSTSSKDITADNITYKDVDTYDWFYKSVLFCKTRGFVKGYTDGSFLPKNKATRAEAFSIVFNMKTEEGQALKLKTASATTPIKSSESVGAIASTNKGNNLLGNGSTDAITKSVSRGGTDIRPVYNLKPSINFGNPFTGGSDYIETKDNSITLEGTLNGNLPKNIEYSVDNDAGYGNKVSVLTAAYPQIVSVVREVYTAKIDWKISIPILKDDLNILTFQVTDVYGNQNSSIVKILKFVDNDNDSLSNYEERCLGTDPNNQDTDGDGLSDYVEAKNTFTDPLKKDTDGDSLTDYDEVVTMAWRTSPTLYSTIGNGPSDPDLDTDGDEISNYDEIYKYHTNPLNADTDGDGLPDGIEINEYGTDPAKADTFSKDINDFQQVINGSIKNINAAKSTIKPLTSSIGVYELPADENLDSAPLKQGDMRSDVILRVQYLLNRLLFLNMKGYDVLNYTGIFDGATKDALFSVFAVDEINGTAFDELVKRVRELPAPDDVITDTGNYIGFYKNDNQEGIKEIKTLLEAWRIYNEPSMHSLYTISSLYEKDGTFSKNFDENAVAMLKLFQITKGLKATGKINDVTMLKLLSPFESWNVDNDINKDGYFIKQSFGDNTFYQYEKDNQLPLNPVYYSQLYGPWSKQPYYAIKRNAPQNGRIVARNGCGPTSTAMIIATLADKNVNPATMAKFSMEHDCITSDYETEGTLFSVAGSVYGLKYEHTTDIEHVRDTLKDGKHLAIGSMGTGHYTGGGHILAMMGTIQLPGEDFDRIILYDSNTGNGSYTDDGTVILSRVPGIVYSKIQPLYKEQVMGFWIISK